MDQEDINYKTLRKIQQQEQNSPSITKIDQKFYYMFSEFIKNLQNMAEKEENTQKKKLFNDEIENTKKIAFNIYELREKKIVQSALSRVRGGKPDLNNLIDIEKQLHDSIVEQINSTRKVILENKKEQKTEEKPEPKIKEENEIKSNKNDILQVIQDTPEFVGTDMETYSLRKDDIITLPKEMSIPLSKRGVIKKIK